MHKMYKPRHIGKEYSHPILFKICPNLDFLTDFVEGNFYMNTNIRFSNIEKEGILTNAQYDRLEGTETLLNATENYELVMDFTEEKARILQGKRGEFEFNGAPIRNVELGRNRPHNIYCLYSMWHGSENGIITKFDNKIRAGLGGFFAMVLNTEEFINRVERAAKKSPYKLKSDIQYGYVNYINIKNQPHVNLGVFKKMIYMHIKMNLG